MKKSKLFAVVLTLILSISLFAVPAFASGGEAVPTVPEGAQEVGSLTPDGNLTLVDDIKGEQSQNKQFITMQSKNGNYFYLVIDRDGDKENVYFLNLVDEADLMALMEDAPVIPEVVPECICDDRCQTGGINTACTVCSVDKSACDGDPIKTTEPIITEGDTSNRARPLIVILIAIFVGGGIFYFMKMERAKKNSKSTMNIDGYDFEDDDDEYDVVEDESDTAQEEDG